MDSPSIEEELHLDFDDSDLRQALENLSDPYREALSMRYVDDLDYGQVAKAAGVSEQNARARVSRAKMVMKAALKGIAVFPVLLFGLLKKSEKVAAAATRTGAITDATGATTSVQVVSSSIPSLVEAVQVAAQVAPTAIPVITKAAVGLGLAAAIFSPAADSAIHNAVDEIAADKGQLIVDAEAAETIAVSSPIVVSNPIGVSTAVNNSVRNEESGVSESEVFWASVSSGQGLDNARDSLTDLTSSLTDSTGDGSLAEQDSVSPIVASPVALGGTVTSAGLLFTESGAGRYEMAGHLRIAVGGIFIEGSLDSDSTIQVGSAVDSDDRYRIDASIRLLLTDGNTMTLRIVGFGVPRENHLQIAGLFKTATDSLNLAEQGSFSGLVNVDSEFGSLELTLTP
jgi:hypothetical protein